MRAFALLVAMTVAASAQPPDRILNLPAPNPPNPSSVQRAVSGTIPEWCCTGSEIMVLREIRGLLKDQDDITDSMKAIDALAAGAAPGDRDSYKKWADHFRAEIARLKIETDIERVRIIIMGIAHANCRPLIKGNVIKYSCRMLI